MPASDPTEMREAASALQSWLDGDRTACPEDAVEVAVRALAAALEAANPEPGTCTDCGGSGWLSEVEYVDGLPVARSSRRCPSCSLSSADEAKATMTSLYGYCPQCNAPSYTRERRPNGNDHCTNGHTYPSRDALRPTVPAPALADEDEALLIDAGHTERWTQDEVAQRLLRNLAARLRALRDERDAERDRADGNYASCERIKGKYSDAVNRIATLEAERAR